MDINIGFILRVVMKPQYLGIRKLALNGTI
jgi:hypothetical protein